VRVYEIRTLYTREATYRLPTSSSSSPRYPVGLPFDIAHSSLTFQNSRFASLLDLLITYARRMGQPTQRATNYTARSNIDTAQICLHANGQRPKRAMIRQRSRRRQRRGEPHTEHGLGVLLATRMSLINRKSSCKLLLVSSCLVGCEPHRV